MKWRWKNFNPDELKCKGTGEAFPLNAYSIDALDKLQKMRDIIGKPFVINSAYRSVIHNRQVGGAKNSMHVQGRAFDIRAAGHDPKVLYKAAIEAGFKGIGFHSSFLHVDNRTVPKQWDYGNDKARHLYIDDSVTIASDYDDDIETEETIAIEAQADGYIAPSPEKGTPKTAIAAGGAIGGVGVLEIAQQASPAINGLSLLDWRVACALLGVLVIAGFIWFLKEKR